MTDASKFMLEKSTTCKQLRLQKSLALYEMFSGECKSVAYTADYLPTVLKLSVVSQAGSDLGEIALFFMLV